MIDDANEDRLDRQNNRQILFTTSQISNDINYLKASQGLANL
jgi:hypothetical protein